MTLHSTLFILALLPCVHAVATRAIVTVVTNEQYALGAVVLGKSLRATGTADVNTDLVVIVPEGSLPATALAWLQSEGHWKVHHPQPTVVDDVDLKSQRADLATIASRKIQAWTLVQYDRVLYMDADTFVRAPVDWLRSDRWWRRTSNVNGLLEFAMKRPAFKTDALVLRPNATVFARLVDSLQSAKTMVNADQTFLNAFFKDEWLARPDEERIPQEELLAGAYCVLAEQQPQYLAPFVRMLARAPAFDWQGRRKPWSPDFPVDELRPLCTLLLPHLSLWTAIAYAPTMRDVRRALDEFDPLTLRPHILQEAVHAAFASLGPAQARRDPSARLPSDSTADPACLTAPNPAHLHGGASPHAQATLPWPLASSESTMVRRAHSLPEEGERGDAPLLWEEPRSSPPAARAAYVAEVVRRTQHLLRKFHPAAMHWRWNTRIKKLKLKLKRQGQGPVRQGPAP
eukprot:TRINITY_DN58694_c0_g1_i1.p1 TRINITY_DN58694_c0_g1~~TRINITY_DN58694_c0_g1_i1.p1  ORF type:complete len:458 (+),score=49.77 TRINITY_DN58694_c0_g1_i1:3-1376(+)